jgi:acyl dehydratase
MSAAIDPPGAATVGMVLGPESFPVRRVDLVRYAGASGDFNAIHFSPIAAAACGLPDVVAHGMFMMGLALRLVNGWTGDPSAVRSCKAQFLRAVAVPDGDGPVISVSGTVTEIGPDGDVTVKLVARCQDKQVVRVTATVRLAGDRLRAESSSGHAADLGETGTSTPRQ